MSSASPPRSRSWARAPGAVFLVHPDQSAIDESYQALRELEHELL